MVPVIEVRILVGERFAGGIGIRTALMMRHLKGVAGFDSRAKHSGQKGYEFITCYQHSGWVLGSTGVRLPSWPQILEGEKMEEEWRPVPGWEGYYEASSEGRVRSLSRVIVNKHGVEQKFRGRILTAHLGNRGYLCVRLSQDGKHKRARVHRLVAEAFHGVPSDENLVCCHNNGVKTDNRAVNLRWGTIASNYHDMEKHGTNPWLNRKECPRGHPLVEPNLSPWGLRNGSRQCLSCARSRSLAIKRGEKDYYKYANRYLAALMNDSAA